MFWVLAGCVGFLAGGIVVRPVKNRRLRLVLATIFALFIAATAALFGAKGAPGEPLNARLDAVDQGRILPQSADLEAQLASLERRARQNPNDGAAALAYGEALLVRGELALAERILARAIRLDPDIRAYVSWAEARVGLAEGEITPAVLPAIDAALEIDPQNPWAGNLRARYLVQQGDAQGALTLWRDIIAQVPQDTPRRAGLTLSAANLLSQPPRISLPANTSPPDANADPRDPARTTGDTVPPQTPQPSPQDMVARVAARVETDPTDLPAWLRLARAQAILGGRDKGQEAIDMASRVFIADTIALEILRLAPLTWPTNLTDQATPQIMSAGPADDGQSSVEPPKSPQDEPETESAP